MCGRYTQGKAVPALVAHYTRLGKLRIAGQQLLPSFNIAPGTSPAVVFRDDEELQLAPLRWGFVPAWAKSLDGLKFKPINARSEGVADSPMFRDAFRAGRCLIPATGFYEWKGEKAPKQQYHIHLGGEALFSMAGLWARWQDPVHGPLQTFAILTTAANETMQPIHHRMPCILPPEEEETWLDPETTPAHCNELLQPYPAKDTIAEPMDTPKQQQSEFLF